MKIFEIIRGFFFNPIRTEGGGGECFLPPWRSFTNNV